MSETVAETPTKQSDECKKEVAQSVAAIRKMSAEDALTKLNEFRSIEGKSEVDASANEAWVKKNLRYAVQGEIFEKHNIGESARIRANREATEAEDPSKEPEKRPGRKRINTAGSFILTLGDPPNLGREGSCKGIILRTLNEAGGEFTYDQFRAAVCKSLDYNEETETFGRETRFPTIQAATAAWFSELKNKNGLLDQAGDATPES